MKGGRWLDTDSLIGRLTVFYALAFSILLGTVFLILLWFVGAALDSRIKEDLAEDIAEFSGYLARHGSAGVIEEMDKEAAGPERETTLLQLYRSNGSLLHSTDLEYWNAWSIDPNRLQEVALSSRPLVIERIALPAQEPDVSMIMGALSPEFVLVIAESNDERDEVMDLLGIALFIMFLLSLPLAAVLVWFLTRRSLLGIKQVSDAAMDIKSGNLARRVEVTGQVAEVQTLADTFDAMAERIQALIRNMREMTDNIAHDLRSPLGRVRLLSESLLRGTSTESDYRNAAQETINECDRLINMINTSLDVAETEAGVSMRAHEQLDMTRLVTDACELFEPVAEQRDISLVCSVEDKLPMTGDIIALQRMVGNILDNAVKFTPPEGEISVSLVRAGEEIILTVRDTGIGIEKADQEQIFNRFFRVDVSRSKAGCGLGLSYSRAVARAHGGTISVSSVKGEYSEFIVVLPLRITTYLKTEHSLSAA